MPKSDKRPRFSIVIPVYNGGRSMSRSLRSVLGQDFQDFEVLVVDDGSTDNTAAIAREWSRKDRRISLLQHERNLGLSAGRVSGIKAATGEYVGFIDCGDTIEPGVLSALDRRICSGGFDVVTGNIYLSFRKLHRKYPYINRALAYIERPQPGEEGYNYSLLKLMLRGDFSTSVFDKFYRRDFLTGHPLIPVEWFCGEDFDFSVHYIPLAASVLETDIFIYNWEFSGLDSKYYVDCWDQYEKSISYAIERIHELFAPDPEKEAESLRCLAHRYHNALISGTVHRSFWSCRRSRKRIFLTGVAERSAVFARLKNFIPELSGCKSSREITECVLKNSRRHARRHRKSLIATRLLSALFGG